jgi:hypothetical protein
VTTEISCRRALALLTSRTGVHMLNQPIGTNRVFYLCGEKVSVIDRDPNIQWQVDYWRAQRDNAKWEYDRGR